VLALFCYELRFRILKSHKVRIALKRKLVQCITMEIEPRLYTSKSSVTVGDPIPPEICLTPFKHNDFNQYTLITPQL